MSNRCLPYAYLFLWIYGFRRDAGKHIKQIPRHDTIYALYNAIIAQTGQGSQARFENFPFQKCKNGLWEGKKRVSEEIIAMKVLLGNWIVMIQHYKIRFRHKSKIIIAYNKSAIDVVTLFCQKYYIFLISILLDNILLKNNTN